MTPGAEQRLAAYDGHVAEIARLRAALVHARTELRAARDTDIGRRLLFHTIDPCLTHINGVLGEPDEHEVDE